MRRPLEIHQNAGQCAQKLRSLWGLINRRRRCSAVARQTPLPRSVCPLHRQQSDTPSTSRRCPTALSGQRGTAPTGARGRTWHAGSAVAARAYKTPVRRLVNSSTASGGGGGEFLSQLDTTGARLVAAGAQVTINKLQALPVRQVLAVSTHVSYGQWGRFI